jgi:hypothetical protein
VAGEVEAEVLSSTLIAERSPLAGLGELLEAVFAPWKYAG